MRDYKLRKRVYNSFVDGEKLEKKTSAMTTPVGVDEEGKLWTSGGGGGGAGSLVCRVLNGTTIENTRLDTKWSVINQAFVEGKAVIILVTPIDTDSTIWARVVTTYASFSDNDYEVLAYDMVGEVVIMKTESLDGYPHMCET